METDLLKEPLFLALTDILHKNTQCSKTWGGLSSVCTKLESARSKSDEIVEINVLQNVKPRALQFIVCSQTSCEVLPHCFTDRTYGQESTFFN